MRAVQATKTPAMRGFLSPLPDSNRGRLLTMEDLGFCYTANEQHFLARFRCRTASSSARRTPSLKRLEPPRKTLNLSPKPVPKQVI